MHQGVLELELYLFKHFVRERGCCLFFAAFIPIKRETYDLRLI